MGQFSARKIKMSEHQTNLGGVILNWWRETRKCFSQKWGQVTCLKSLGGQLQVRQVPHDLMNETKKAAVWRLNARTLDALIDSE